MNEFYSRAFEYYHLGYVVEARNEALRGLQEQPDDAYCHSLLALIASEGKDKKGTSFHITKALCSQPANAYIHCVASACYLNLGQTFLAEGSALRALALDQSECKYHLQYARVLGVKRKWPVALHEVEVALQLNPESSEALAFKIQVLTVLGRKSEAAELSKELLRADPDNADPHQAAGYAALARGDTADAIAAYREALRLNPNSAANQEGLLEALRARSGLYGRFYRLDLWLQSKPIGTVFVGYILLVRVPALLFRREMLPPVLLFPFGLLWLGLFALTLVKVFSRFFSNVLLALDPVGRILLNPHEKAESFCFFASVFAFCLAVGLLFANSTARDQLLGIAFAGAIGSCVMTILNRANEKGPARWAMFSVFAFAEFGSIGYLLKGII